MKPERIKILEFGTKIEEYYWGGDLVVYIDNRLSNLTFDEAVVGETESKKYSQKTKNK
jgi:hypothetical protein